MAKGDDSRARNKLDEQQGISQGYLGGLQQQLGGQYGRLNDSYFGPYQSQYGNLYNAGTGIARYTPSLTGVGYTGGQTGSSSFDRNAALNFIKQYQSQNAYAPGQFESLVKAMQGAGIPAYLATHMGNTKASADKIVLPDGSVLDLVNSVGGAGAKWQLGDDGVGAYDSNQKIVDPSTGKLVEFGQFQPGYQGRPNEGGVFGRALSDYGSIFDIYKGWTRDGGLSESDKANIRSRALSPIRAAYSDAEREMERGKSLSGGYSPGLNAARLRMAREQGQLGSDATTNAEAAIAEMVRQGKMFGVGGMSNIYGATPGMANMVGNQMMGSMDQQLRASLLQNQLGLGLTQNQIAAGQLPGKFQSAMGNIGSVLGLGGQIAGMGFPWFKPKGGAIPGVGSSVSIQDSWGM